MPALAVGGQTAPDTMTEDIYGEAFCQMAEAPPEPNENTGPGRRPGKDGTGNRNRWKAHTKRAHISIRIDADVYLWLREQADHEGKTVRDRINDILNREYAARPDSAEKERIMNEPKKVTVQDVDGSAVEGFQFADGKTVCVDHNVWMLDSNGNQISGPSGADYYYSERGYNCRTAQEVAEVFKSCS